MQIGSVDMTHLHASMLLTIKSTSMRTFKRDTNGSFLLRGTVKLLATKVEGLKDCFPRGTSPGRAKDNVAYPT